MKQNEVENKAEETETKQEAVIGENNVNKPSFLKVICANILDQLLIVATSSLLLLLFDFVLKIFGYRVVRENAVLVLLVGAVYFIINCIYSPLMIKTKLKNTIARKILNI